MALKKPVTFEDHPVISRDEARMAGLPWYFTKERCYAGHISPRNVNSNSCILCNRKAVENWKTKMLSKDEDGVKARARAYRAADPAGQMIRVCRARAKRKGIEFTVARDDISIASDCPCCSQPMSVRSGPRKQGPTPRSPSLDRINSSRGYVPGNVAVICWRCNELKRNASVGELKKIIQWMEGVEKTAIRLVQTAAS